MVLSVVLNLVRLQSDQQRIQPNGKQAVGGLRQSDPLGNLCDLGRLQPLPTKVSIFGNHKPQVTTSEQEFHPELNQNLRKNVGFGTGFPESRSGLSLECNLSKHRKNAFIQGMNPPESLDQLHLGDHEREYRDSPAHR